MISLVICCVMSIICFYSPPYCYVLVNISHVYLSLFIVFYLFHVSSTFLFLFSLPKHKGLVHFRWYACFSFVSKRGWWHTFLILPQILGFYSWINEFYYDLEQKEFSKHIDIYKVVSYMFSFIWWGMVFMVIIMVVWVLGLLFSSCIPIKPINSKLSFTKIIIKQIKVSTDKSCW